MIQYICRIKEIADYLSYSIKKIKNARVETDICKSYDIEIPDDESETASCFVASLRLDCVLSAGLKLSRSRALELIKAERVYLNWDKTSDAKKPLKEGDMISIRGKGRLLLENINGKSKKDRTNITLKRYL